MDDVPFPELLVVAVVTSPVTLTPEANFNVPSFPANPIVVILFVPVAFKVAVPAAAYAKLVADIAVPEPPNANVPVPVTFSVVP